MWELTIECCRHGGTTTLSLMFPTRDKAVEAVKKAVSEGQGLWVGNTYWPPHTLGIARVKQVS